MLVTIGSLTSMSWAQQQTKFGLGFELHTFPSTFMMNEEGSGMGLYFPVEVGGFLIEPQIAYLTQERDFEYFDDDYGDNHGYKKTDYQLLVGLFKLVQKGNFKHYAGFRVGKAWHAEEEWSNNTDEVSENVEDNFAILAPAVGSQYFVAEGFSFGAEGILLTYGNLDRESYHARTVKNRKLITKFIARFHF